MVCKIDGINVHYERLGNNQKRAIIYLHGWGQNTIMMEPIAKPFYDEFDTIVVDLPGFGDSEEPKRVYTVYDYAECIYKLCKKLNVSNPILIGHSFGGKVSLVFASKYGASKLILFGSPFKKEIEKLSLKTKILKQAKKIPLINRFSEVAKRHIGSTDYRSASAIMREILVSTVNLDITYDVKKITCPTLIVWGDLDAAVPLEDAYTLEGLIKDAAVIVYEGCTHYAYLENLGQTISIIGSFVRS